jgi:stage V sporulation protein G
MKIEVKVFPIDKPQGSTLAFAKVTVSSWITINNARVVNGQNGLFTAMPQELDKDGNYRDIVKLETQEAYNEINKAILGEYVVISQRRQRQTGQNNTKQTIQRGEEVRQQTQQANRQTPQPPQEQTDYPQYYGLPKVDIEY